MAIAAIWAPRETDTNRAAAIIQGRASHHLGPALAQALRNASIPQGRNNTIIIPKKIGWSVIPWARLRPIR